jgi:hypothetical protein
MRVGEAGPREEPRATTAGKFTEALERAESRGGGRTRGGPQPLRHPPERSRSAADGGDGAAEGSPALAAAARGPPAPEPTPIPELAAVARAVPVAIAAGGLRDGAPLALSFGRSLDVELRTGVGGVELRLVPEARLARAAEAELPRVVAALRQRGIAVARAEVRPRAGGRAR